MKVIVILLSIAMVYGYSWTVDYAGAKKVPSSRFTLGRQGHNITCKDFSS